MECIICKQDKELRAKRMCRSCYERQLKELNPEYAQRQRENCKNWRVANADKCKQREQERWANKDYVEQQRVYKWNKLLESYGLNQNTYEILVEQGCQLCGNTNAAKYHLDHCHTTGNFRGLLCSKCNNGLGMLGDSIASLERALEYLKQAESQTTGN